MKNSISISMLQWYVRGFRKFDRENPENTKFSVKWSALVDEVNEFIEEPSWEEFFDVLHVAARFSGIPGLGLLIAYPTAKKHAVRYSQRGCIRSERNCKARCKHI